MVGYFELIQSINLGSISYNIYKPSISFYNKQSVANFTTKYLGEKNVFVIYFGVGDYCFIKQPYFKFVFFTIQLTVLA